MLLSTGRPFWEAAGVEDKIDLRIAPASTTMDSFLQVHSPVLTMQVACRTTMFDKQMHFRWRGVMKTLEQVVVFAVQNGEEGTFDMGFIDADKTGYDTYYEQLLKLLRPGGVIVVDNTLWDGSVINPERQDPDTVVMTCFSPVPRHLHHLARCSILNVFESWMHL